MLLFPVATTREEKLVIIDIIKQKLLRAHSDRILAIGVYGSIGQGTEGSFSDIEMHIVTKDGVELQNHEFIYDKFKIELNMVEKSKLFENARMVDDGWAIKAGFYVNIMKIYDPDNVFDDLKELPLRITDEEVKETMREFMIWEPYETVGKIRNNFRSSNLNYIPIGAYDLLWQSAKLIGLANKQYYTTRARTIEESLVIANKPSGYAELALCVMKGKLDDKRLVYQLCENLWTGLNDWYEELGISYKLEELPF